MSDNLAVPKWLDKIRFISRYYISGCSAPTGLYAEKAIPQAKETVLILSGLQLGDIVKEVFRPKGLRSKRHGRKGVKSGNSFGGIPDINETIGTRIRNDIDLPKFAYNILGAVFYVVDDIIDRIAWTALVLEMSQDLVYESLLGVLTHDSKFCPFIKRLWMRAGYHVEGVPLGAWGAINLGAELHNVGPIFHTGNVINFEAGEWSVTYGCQMISPSQTHEVQLRFVNPLPPFNEYNATPWVEVNPVKPSYHVLNVTVKGPCQLAVQGRETGSFWDIIRSDIMVLQINVTGG